MKTYVVEMHGEVRELYEVKANSAEEAEQRWAEGDMYLSESYSMEVYSVIEEDAE